MKFYDVPGSAEPWRAAAMPTGEVVWRGRIYDLANVVDLTALAEDLKTDNAEFEADIVALTTTVAAGAVDEKTAALNAEADRLRAQIARDEARTAAMTDELHAQGISTAPPAEVDALVAQWKREYGDTPTPKLKPQSARQKAINEQRERAGY